LIFRAQGESKMVAIPKTDIVEICILSTEGCMNTPRTILRIEEVAKALAVPIHIENVQIKTLEEARKYRFFGSPTVQINGVDIDPEKRESTAFGLA